MKRCMVVLAVFLGLSVHAGERVDRDEITCRIPTARADRELVDLYLSLTDLPLQDQREQTWGMPSLTKSALWTYNIERYLRDHPDMSAQAQEILREGIGLVSAPAWFDIGPGVVGYDIKTMALEGFKDRAKRVLSRETIVETFIRLGREPDSATEPERSPGGKVESNGFSCSCGSYFDCGRQDRDCFDSWCFTVYHCGWYSDEPCWGNCKSIEP